jgi:DNA-binding protein YbaB
VVTRSVGNGGLHYAFDEVFALVRDQMRDVSELDWKRSLLVGVGSAADGLVKVTVNGRCVVIETVVDEGYFDEFTVANLGDSVTAAAQDAAQQLRVQALALLKPLARRRAAISGLVGTGIDAPGSATASSHPGGPLGDGPDGGAFYGHGSPTR